MQGLVQTREREMTPCNFRIYQQAILKKKEMFKTLIDLFDALAPRLI